MKTPEQQLAADRAAVMLAFSEGKKIEKSYKGKNEWSNTSPVWDWDNYDYRIKPKPRRCWVTTLRMGDCQYLSDSYTGARSYIREAADTIVAYVELTPEVRAALEAAGIIEKEDV